MYFCAALSRTYRRFAKWRHAAPRSKFHFGGCAGAKYRHWMNEERWDGENPDGYWSNRANCLPLCVCQLVDRGFDQSRGCLYRGHRWHRHQCRARALDRDLVGCPAAIPAQSSQDLQQSKPAPHRACQRGRESDPVDMDVPALSDLAISLFLPKTTAATTTHILALQPIIAGPTCSRTD
jgi:hypothetical protein